MTFSEFSVLVQSNADAFYRHMKMHAFPGMDFKAVQGFAYGFIAAKMGEVKEVEKVSVQGSTVVLIYNGFSHVFDCNARFWF